MSEIPEKLYSMEDFRAEIQGIAEGERKAKEGGEVSSGHFADFPFDVVDLTEEDMKIWEKIKSEEITLEEFREYDKKFRDENGPDALSQTSRGIFVQFAGNRTSPAIFHREQKLKS